MKRTLKRELNKYLKLLRGPSIGNQLMPARFAQTTHKNPPPNTQKQQSKFSHKLDRWLPRTPQSAWPDSGHEHITHTHTYICVCCLHKKHRAATSEIPAPPTRGGGEQGGEGLRVSRCVCVNHTAHAQTNTKTPVPVIGAGRILQC